MQGQKKITDRAQDFLFLSEKLKFVQLGHHHCSDTIELALMIDLAMHCMFLNNDKCTVEIN